jgi:hypothetical protein
MFAKIANPFDPFWRTLLLWLVAAFKSIEVVRALFSGTDTWLDQAFIMLLFLAACVLANRHDLASNKAARRARIGLVILLTLSLLWSTLRTTHNVVANRMEYDRLVLVHRDMKLMEEWRLRSVYRKYAEASQHLRCETAVPLNKIRCADLTGRIDEIAKFRLTQPEQSESAETFRAALRERQENFRKLLFDARIVSKRLPKAVDFPVARKQYGYWETVQWMRDNPTRIEVQAVMGRLMSHGLVMTIAMLLASMLDLFKLPVSKPVMCDPVPVHAPVPPGEPEPLPSGAEKIELVQQAAPARPSSAPVAKEVA